MIKGSDKAAELKLPVIIQYFVKKICQFEKSFIYLHCSDDVSP